MLARPYYISKVEEFIETDFNKLLEKPIKSIPPEVFTNYY